MLDKSLDKKFVHIIARLEKLRRKYGFYYDEDCINDITKARDAIVKDNLIAKCEDKDFAKMLCIVNGIEIK